MSIENLDSLKAGFVQRIAQAEDLEGLDAIRVQALGKKGAITGLMKTLGVLSLEERKAAGQALNVVKQEVASAIENRKDALEEQALNARLVAESLDVSLPPRPALIGRRHPISQTIEELIAIFGEMGFSVAEGPHIEDDFYNFTALNIPPEHPARQEFDTFYMPAKSDGSRPLLRTHTSPVQIRTMQNSEPPIRIIAPGRTFRADHDATHSPMFHQIEGLVIDRATNMGDLKGTLIEFYQAFFRVKDLPVRFRPSFFPFTEPSAEVDIGCTREGERLKIGAGDDWLEILGCGMVHPKVLEACGIDSTLYQGFAFGMGVERIAMLKYGVSDLRAFYESDLRWMKHYGFVPLDLPSMVRGL